MCSPVSSSVVALALALALSGVMLSGCAELHRGFEAIGHPASSARPAEEVDLAPVLVPNVKTVRPRRALRPSATDASAAEPATSTIVASAVPTPQQIFDFHPPGSAPGSFRQPFVIDPNDGPLTADVRKTAAELKAFKLAMKSGPVVVGSKPCGEDDVAHGKTGCSGGNRKVAGTVSHEPVTLQ